MQPSRPPNKETQSKQTPCTLPLPPKTQHPMFGLGCPQTQFFFVPITTPSTEPELAFISMKSSRSCHHTPLPANETSQCAGPIFQMDCLFQTGLLPFIRHARGCPRQMAQAITMVWSTHPTSPGHFSGASNPNGLQEGKSA